MADTLTHPKKSLLHLLRPGDVVLVGFRMFERMGAGDYRDSTEVPRAVHTSGECRYPGDDEDHANHPGRTPLDLPEHGGVQSTEGRK